MRTKTGLRQEIMEKGLPMFDQEKAKGMMSLAGLFLLGGLIGAGLALLMAPNSGKKTRAMIMDKSNAIKDRAVGAVDDTRSRAGHAIEGVKSKTSDTVSSIRKRGSELNPL